MSLSHEQRETIRYYRDLDARNKIANGYLDCDPESLTIKAAEAEELGHKEIASALRKFRDDVVNVLIGEGWDLNRIEIATLNWSEKKHNAT